MLESLN